MVDPHSANINPEKVVRSAASSTREFAQFFFRAYRSRTILMIGLMSVAGFAESFGVLALVPILELANGGEAAPSRISSVMLGLLRGLHIQPTLPALLATVVIAISLKAVLLSLAGRQAGYMTAQVGHDLRVRLMQALLYARWDFFGQKPIGRFASAIGAEVNRTAAAYREGCHFVAAIVQITAYLAVSAAFSWRVTLVTVFAGTVLTLVFLQLFRRSRAAGVAQTRHNKALAARLVDVLQGMKPLKAMSRETLVWPLLQAETEALNRAQRSAVQAHESRNLLYEPIVTALLALGLMIVLEVGNQPLPQVLVLAFIFYRIMQHVNTLQVRYQTLITGEGAFLSVTQELAEAEAARETSDVDPAPNALRERLELRDLCFSYGTRDLLRGVNLDIPAGSFIAITGESGSGKTTLADLLVGLRTPDRGDVVIDGAPLRDLDVVSWRRTIGYVPQEMLVFNDTVARNVTLGDASLTQADIERALRLAGAWDFVMEKPGGLEHRIGDRGSALSGGQRQRIAIARALVWRPSLLVLDEVTTSLDPLTEADICNTLRSLTGETTIVVISHQPALRKAADAAFVLRHGRLAALKPGVAAH